MGGQASLIVCHQFIIGRCITAGHHLTLADIHITALTRSLVEKREHGEKKM
jgi:hypothetical protein